MWNEAVLEEISDYPAINLDFVKEQIRKRKTEELGKRCSSV